MDSQARILFEMLFQNHPQNCRWELSLGVSMENKVMNTPSPNNFILIYY